MSTTEPLRKRIFFELVESVKYQAAVATIGAYGTIAEVQGNLMMQSAPLSVLLMGDAVFVAGEPINLDHTKFLKSAQKLGYVTLLNLAIHNSYHGKDGMTMQTSGDHGLPGWEGGTAWMKTHQAALKDRAMAPRTFNQKPAVRGLQPTTYTPTYPEVSNDVKSVWRWVDVLCRHDEGGGTPDTLPASTLTDTALQNIINGACTSARDYAQAALDARAAQAVNAPVGANTSAVVPQAAVTNAVVPQAAVTNAVVPQAAVTNAVVPQAAEPQAVVPQVAATPSASVAPQGVEESLSTLQPSSAFALTVAGGSKRQRTDVTSPVGHAIVTSSTALANLELPQNPTLPLQTVKKLVNLGVQDGVGVLCQLPSKLAERLVTELLSSEQIVRKRLMNKIITNWTNHRYDVLMKTYTQLTKEELQRQCEEEMEEMRVARDEFLEEQQEERDAARLLERLRVGSLPWTNFNLNEVLQYFHKMVGLLGGSKEALFALLPTFKEATAKYLSHSKVQPCMGYDTIWIVDGEEKEFIIRQGWLTVGLEQPPTARPFRMLPAHEERYEGLYFTKLIGKPPAPTAVVPTIPEGEDDENDLIVFLRGCQAIFDASNGTNDAYYNRCVEAGREMLTLPDGSSYMALMFARESVRWLDFERTFENFLIRRRGGEDKIGKHEIEDLLSPHSLTRFDIFRYGEECEGVKSDRVTGFAYAELKLIDDAAGSPDMPPSDLPPSLVAREVEAPTPPNADAVFINAPNGFPCGFRAEQGYPTFLDDSGRYRLKIKGGIWVVWDLNELESLAERRRDGLDFKWYIDGSPSSLFCKGLPIAFEGTIPETCMNLDAPFPFEYVTESPTVCVCNDKPQYMLERTEDAWQVCESESRKRQVRAIGRLVGDRLMWSIVLPDTFGVSDPPSEVAPSLVCNGL